MRQLKNLKCPECCQNFFPEKVLFCYNCLHLNPHYSPTANRLNSGNGYYQCCDCGAETTIDISAEENKKFKKLGKKYKAPESY